MTRRSQNVYAARGWILPVDIPRKSLSLARGPAPTSTPLVPIKPRLHCLAIPQDPSDSVPGDEFERRYFQLFLEKLSVDLCGYFETPFVSIIESTMASLFCVCSLCGTQRELLLLESLPEGPPSRNTLTISFSSGQSSSRKNATTNQPSDTQFLPSVRYTSPQRRETAQ